MNTESAASGERAKKSAYERVGVLSNENVGLRSLLKWVNRTADFRKNTGVPVFESGYFANVVAISARKGIAISTDGVGTKILVAEMMGKFDTLGIDLVAMNVNDVICVGAEPLSLVDYIAVNTVDEDLLEALGKGLYQGAEAAAISIVGGELAQVQEMIRGRGKYHMDLVGTCIGLVELERIIDGERLGDGDVIVGLESSGIHSNGFTLARRVLLDEADYGVDQNIAELDRTLGEELLEPTRIYVKPVMAALESGADIKALINITGDGFLNLNRVSADVSFEIQSLPQPKAIFDLIQRSGRISDEEMFRVFNMGVGFCIIVGANDADDLMRVLEKELCEAMVIGRVVSEPGRAVTIHPKRIRGGKDGFSGY